MAKRGATPTHDNQTKWRNGEPPHESSMYGGVVQGLSPTPPHVISIQADCRRTASGPPVHLPISLSYRRTVEGRRPAHLYVLLQWRNGEPPHNHNDLWRCCRGTKSDPSTDQETCCGGGRGTGVGRNVVRPAVLPLRGGTYPVAEPVGVCLQR